MTFFENLKQTWLAQINSLKTNNRFTDNLLTKIIGDQTLQMVMPQIIDATFARMTDCAETAFCEGEDELLETKVFKAVTKQTDKNRTLVILGAQYHNFIIKLIKAGYNRLVIIDTNPVILQYLYEEMRTHQISTEQHLQTRVDFDEAMGFVIKGEPIFKEFEFDKPLLLCDSLPTLDNLCLLVLYNHHLIDNILILPNPCYFASEMAVFSQLYAIPIVQETPSYVICSVLKYIGICLQTKATIQCCFDLADLNPELPSLKEGAISRIVKNALINDPFGGCYLFSKPRIFKRSNNADKGFFLFQFNADKKTAPIQCPSRNLPQSILYVKKDWSSHDDIDKLIEDNPDVQELRMAKAYSDFSSTTLEELQKLSDQDIRYQFLVAAKLFDQNKYKESLLILEDMQQKYPDDQLLLHSMMRKQSLYHKQIPQNLPVREMIETSKKLLALCPDDANGWLVLANAYQLSDNNKQAFLFSRSGILCYMEGSQNSMFVISPETLSLLHYLQAILLEKDGHHKLAQEKYLQAYSIYADNYEAVNALLTKYFKEDKQAIRLKNPELLRKNLYLLKRIIDITEKHLRNEKNTKDLITMLMDLYIIYHYCDVKKAIEILKESLGTAFVEKYKTILDSHRQKLQASSMIK